MLDIFSFLPFGIQDFQLILSDFLFPRPIEHSRVVKQQETNKLLNIIASQYQSYCLLTLRFHGTDLIFQESKGLSL